MKKKKVQDLELGSNVYSICRKRSNLESEVGVFEYKAIIENESIRRLWNDGSTKRINKTKKYIVECTKDVDMLQWSGNSVFEIDNSRIIAASMDELTDSELKEIYFNHFYFFYTDKTLAEKLCEMANKNLKLMTKKENENG